jgi:hypothetical protein
VPQWSELVGTGVKELSPKINALGSIFHITGNLEKLAFKLKLVFKFNTTNNIYIRTFLNNPCNR